MNENDGRIGRRDALGMALGVGAGVALRPRAPGAREAGCDDLGAAREPMADVAARRRMAAPVDGRKEMGSR
jgi:hypothetical protein